MAEVRIPPPPPSPNDLPYGAFPKIVLAPANPSRNAITMRYYDIGLRATSIYEGGRKVRSECPIERKWKTRKVRDRISGKVVDYEEYDTNAKKRRLWEAGYDQAVRDIMHGVAGGTP